MLARSGPVAPDLALTASARAGRGRTVRFNHTGDLFKTIERIGLMPLPPWSASQIAW